MSEHILVKKLRLARTSWLNLESDVPGSTKRVRIIRPAETEIGEFLQRAPDGGLRLVADVPQCKRFVVDWEGITEADLLGAAVGSSDPLPFSPELWAEVCADRADWCRVVSVGLVEVITAHTAAKDEATKN